MTEGKKQKVAQVEQLRAEGKTLSEIAAIMGVSKSRIRDHIKAGEWQREYEKSNDWLVRSGFSVRLCNSLCNAGINSREQLLRAVKAGRLNPRPGGTRNYGYKSHTEVLKWLGLPDPGKPGSRVEPCPHCGQLVPYNLFLRKRS
jgi:hypothetical protein